MSENQTRPGSGQEVRGERKRCFRHQELFPDETKWRLLDEFWAKPTSTSGLQSRCKRCAKMLKHSAKGLSERIKRSKISAKDSADVHVRIHRDTKKMLDRLREKDQLSLSAIVDEACLQYVMRRLGGNA